MSRSLLIFSFVLSTNINYGQNSILISKISFQDSILLNDFWTNFKNAINENDKEKLATLCAFPFNCRPCIDDTSLKVNDQVTIKVTKKLFVKSQYKIFFEEPIKNEVKKHNQIVALLSFEDKNVPNGYMFSYTIIAPSKDWEGLQGFVFLQKIRNRYKITGIDTVP